MSFITDLRHLTTINLLIQLSPNLSSETSSSHNESTRFTMSVIDWVFRHTYRLVCFCRCALERGITRPAISAHLASHMTQILAGAPMLVVHQMTCMADTISPMHFPSCMATVATRKSHAVNCVGLCADVAVKKDWCVQKKNTERVAVVLWQRRKKLDNLIWQTFASLIAFNIYNWIVWLQKNSRFKRDFCFISIILNNNSKGHNCLFLLALCSCPAKIWMMFIVPSF